MLQTLIWFAEAVEDALVVTKGLFVFDRTLFEEVSRLVGRKNVLEILAEGVQDPGLHALDRALSAEIADFGQRIFSTFGHRVFSIPEEIRKLTEIFFAIYEAMHEPTEAPGSVETLLIDAEKSLSGLKEALTKYRDGIDTLIQRAKKRADFRSLETEQLSDFWRSDAPFLLLCRKDTKRAFESLSDRITYPSMKGPSALLLMSPLTGAKILSPTIIAVISTDARVAAQLLEALRCLKKVQKSTLELIERREREILLAARSQKKFRLI